MDSLSDKHPIRKDVELIHDSSERGSTLTRQLLAFSRGQILQSRVFSLEELISRMEPMLNALIEDVVDLRIEFFHTRQMVNADPGQIEQVVMNLCVNARDAMTEGGQLTIATEAVEFDLPHVGSQSDIPAGKYSVLSVSDTGTGIEDGIRNHLFEPFFTTKEEGKGTGLGLSTAYGIVQQTGGHIDVDSQLGQGTTFRIYLPAVDEAATPEKSSTTGSAPRGGTETILVVEDEKVVRDLVQDILESNGYIVIAAEDGPTAVAISENFGGAIQLMITDVMMPRITGPELSERLHSRRPDMKVLYMSGYTDPVGGRLPKDCTYIAKPFSKSGLIQKIREILDASVE